VVGQIVPDRSGKVVGEEILKTLRTNRRQASTSAAIGAGVVTWADLYTCRSRVERRRPSGGQD